MDVECLPDAAMVTSADSQSDDSVTEIRQYDLNKQKAMTKKLSATEEASFTTEITGGGVKLCFNAGMYELFRVAADELFMSDSMKTKCKKVIVKDKNKIAVVETKYKVRVKNAHYMMNLYHTTCNCLVNGKSTIHFINHDMMDIFDRIKLRLDSGKFTVDQFNDQIRQMIQSYYEHVDLNQEDRDGVVESVASLTYSDTVMNCSDLKDVNVVIEDLCADETLVKTCVNADLESDSIGDDSTKSSITTADLYKLLMNVNLIVRNLNQKNEHLEKQLEQQTKEMRSMKQQAKEYREIAERQISVLKDEVTSIKKLYYVYNTDTTSNITDLSGTLHSEISKMSATINKQLQSIFGMLKQQLDKVDTRKANDETVPKCVDSGNDNVSEVNHPTPVTTSIPNRVTDRRHIERSRTLIVGDSILKAISKRGLNRDIDIRSLSGGDINTVSKHCKEIDLQQYTKVVLYIGGNNTARGQTMTVLYKELKSLVLQIKNAGCQVYISTVCPRADTDVMPYNDVINQICDELNVSKINSYSTFIYGDGSTVRQYYYRDGIHLSRSGTSILLQTLNKAVTIMSRKTTRDHGFNNGHYTRPNYNSGRSRGNPYFNQQSGFRNRGRFSH